MRLTLLVLTTLSALFSLHGFGSYRQSPVAIVELLDRSGRTASKITDGDTVRIRVTLPGSPGSSESITFKLDDTNIVVGTCMITSDPACKTDPLLSLGWYWDSGGVPRGTRTIKGYNAHGQLIAQSTPITVLPRPVVLVHGFISSWDTWKLYLASDGYLASLGLHGYAVGDGQVPGRLNTGVITNPIGRTNTLAENAAVERQYIDAVKKATGAQMVDLVVHSMGGMISRYYIDRIMGERDVAQLIMLGSPMGGTDCAVLPAALGFFLPASLEIRQTYMQGVFNRQITHRHGVQFYDLGGTAISQAFQSPCAAVPNDLAVPFESVNAIPLRSAQLAVLHTDLTTSTVVFHTFVQPLLQKSVGAFDIASDPEPSSIAAPPLQFNRVYTGHVDAGASQEISITIEPQVTVASFAMYDPTRSIGVSVRGASGNVVSLDPQRNGFVRIEDPSSLVYLGYGFSNPKPGVWKVTVLATPKTPPSGADFAISVYFVGGASLNAQSDTLIPKLGQPVHFNATLSLNGQLLDITRAQATLRGTDGKTETVDFKPGTQVSATWSPRAPGTYGVDIVVTVQLPDGSSIERTAFLAEEVQPNPSRLQVSLNLILVLAAFLLAAVLLILLIARLSRRLLHRT
jgi:pimeloyl-ACP methyl ester carboxylesterase